MSEFLSPDDQSLDERERRLIRIGREAIGQENPEKLAAYFAKDYIFHGPDGSSTFDELSSFFSAMRKALTGFSCERRSLISHGEFIGARTAMFGTFEDTFTASRFGPVRPNGQSVTLEIINLFKYNPEGELVEEWVQYDNLGFMRQLGVELKP